MRQGQFVLGVLSILIYFLSRFALWANTTLLPAHFGSPGAYTEAHTERKTTYDLCDLVLAKVYNP